MKRTGWKRESARHSLAARGVKTPHKSAMGFYSDGREVKMKAPPILYHGTLAKNIPKICEQGILPSSPERATTMTKETGHLKDTLWRVSLARKRGDAVMFAYGSAPRGEPIAIIEVDSSKLTDYKIFFSTMFGRELSEASYLGIVPPSAIKRVEVTEFKDGKMSKRDVTCEVLS